LAVSLTFGVAVRLPVATGVKVTEIAHEDAAATLPQQLSISAKSPGRDASHAGLHIKRHSAHR
jgi:hypothetical protein